MIKKIDWDNDGKIEKFEVEIYNRKTRTQRGMAIVALIALICTGVYLLGFASPEQLKALGSLLDLYFISLGGIVGAYMGFSSWVSGSSGRIK